MKRKDQDRLRFVAWACVLVLLITAASPAAAGVPPVILAPPAPLLGEPGACRLPRACEETSPPNLAPPVRVPARAPPLA